MKKILLAIVLCSSLGISHVMAAVNEEAIQKRVAEVKSEFNLNDRQAKRIAHILSRAGMSRDEKKAARMEKRMAKRLNRMKEKLDLSDEQLGQIKHLMTEQHGQMRMLREQGKASIYKILTAEQSNKFDKMMAKRKRHRGHHGKKMHYGEHGGMCNKNQH